MSFRPEKQSITMPDGTIFQPACYASDYDWSQHVDAETKAGIGEVEPDYDWTQHVSIETRDYVRGLCVAQMEADQLAYAAILGEELDEVSLSKIEASKSHNGTARRYDDKPTPEAKAMAKLYAKVDKAAPKNAEYAEKMLAFVSLAQDGSLTAKQALDAAKIANQERKAAKAARIGE